MTIATKDQRPVLQIAEQTWDREDDEGRRRLVDLAAAQGFQLTVVYVDGRAWTPEPLVSDW